MNKNKIFPIIGGVIVLVIAGVLIKGNSTKPTEIVQEKTNISSPADKPKPTANTTVYLGQQTNPDDEKNKLCGWVDESDIIIKLNFAEGVNKDTSYETGFAFSTINRTARLARSGCDYRTGFKFSELKGKGVVQIAVWGYTDNKRRMLLNEPINVTFDAEGKPNVSLPIEVTVLD